MPDGDGVPTEMEAGGMPYGDNTDLADRGVNIRKSKKDFVNKFQVRV